MKLFVWEEVLCGALSGGIVVVYAEDLEQALRLVHADDPSAWRELTAIDPEIVVVPTAFITRGCG